MTMGQSGDRRQMMIYAHGDETCYCCGRSHKTVGMGRPLILTDKGWVCATDDFCRAGTTPVRRASDDTVGAGEQPTSGRPLRGRSETSAPNCTQDAREASDD